MAVKTCSGSPFLSICIADDDDGDDDDDDGNDDDKDDNDNDDGDDDGDDIATCPIKMTTEVCHFYAILRSTEYKHICLHIQILNSLVELPSLPVHLRAVPFQTFPAVHVLLKLPASCL